MPPAENDAPTMLAVRSEDGSLAEVTLSMRDGAEPTPVATLRRGDVLGRYVVLDTLGQGGMGVVYAAYDPELDRKVALKLVRWERGAETQGSVGRSRLLREAQALAKLTHPNVVGVYDVGTWQQAVFVAMELVEGQTVSRWIDRRHAESPPAWREVLAVMIPAGRGLEAAHAVGIVHRDFKPENVMLSSSGRVTVLDFGLARASDGPGSEPVRLTAGGVVAGASSSMQLRLTATGSVMGTPAYMAPEQLSGKISDASSDQFAFCVALYHALYGMRPFAGSTLPELTHAVLRGEIEPAPRGSRVPAWLRRVVVRGLSTVPAQRYSSMTELLAALGHDPARRRGRVLLGLGTVGLLGASWWGASRLASVEDPCAAVDGAMGQAWGASQRAALEQAFGRDAKTYSEQALARVGESLDRYAAGWVQERRAACEAGRQAGTDEGRDAGLQAACLDQRLRRLDALVRLLGDADQSMVAKASSAVQELPDPTGCRDAQGWRRSAPVPDDPAQQEQVESLRLRMAEVHALSATGRLKEALTQVEALLAEARALGFAPAVAEMLMAAGGVRTQMGEYAAALPLLEEGLLLARAHGLEQLEADLLSPLAFLHTNYSGQLELAAWHARVNEVLVERLGDRPLAKARVLLDRARLERKREQLAASIDLFVRAIELYEEDGTDLPGLVVAYDNLAASYVSADRIDDAVRTLARAETVATEALGADHPHRGNLLVHAARIEASRKQHDSAIAKLRAARALYEGAYGEHHPNIAAVLNGLGLELEEVGRLGEAIDAFRGGLAIVERAFGLEHTQVAIIQANLGNSLRRDGRAEEGLALHRAAHQTRERLGVAAEGRYELLDNIGDDLRVLGRCEEAEAEYRAANALRETVGEHDDPGAAYAFLGIGLCEQQRGQGARAAKTLESALRLANGREEDDAWSRQTRALVRFALAMALRQAEPSSQEAVALAEQARAFWAEDAVQYAGLLRQHDAWVAGGPAAMLVY
jgi:tetratricopeptide (TPR) repeat protein